MAGSFIVTPVETGVQERVNLLKHWIPAFAGMTAKDGFSPFAIRPLRGASKRQAPGSAGDYDLKEAGPLAGRTAPMKGATGYPRGGLSR